MVTHQEGFRCHKPVAVLCVKLRGLGNTRSVPVRFGCYAKKKTTTTATKKVRHSSVVQSVSQSVSRIIIHLISQYVGQTNSHPLVGLRARLHEPGWLGRRAGSVCRDDSSARYYMTRSSSPAAKFRSCRVKRWLHQRAWTKCSYSRQSIILAYHFQFYVALWSDKPLCVI